TINFPYKVAFGSSVWIILLVAPLGILDVPVILQEEDFTCVPVCLRMVIEYLNRNILRSQIGDLEIPNIVTTVRCKRIGTSIYDVRNMNETSELLRAIPSVEFKAENTPREWDQIEREIHEGRPVIPYL